ncbi:MAG TPA: glycogen/starch synthase [Rubricoccaceae bacterium]|jgi:starch synthase|nr:glycogen/starch synthase [Rubricoccaceae bacterium]
MKILYVAGEVAPFSETTEAARLMRTLPETVGENGTDEVRIMMPRYGVVSERRNRLHEVIRLSGTEVVVGADKETLKVKVASIPGLRLQVYFMDSAKYFKRKGLHKLRKEGTVFEDNPARALFFARAALLTARKLGWGPDVIHASGWIAAFVPYLLQEEFADDPLFADTKSVYTPDETDVEIGLSAEEAAALGLPEDFAGKTLQQIGLDTADAVVHAEGPGEAAGEEGVVEHALAVYRTLTGQQELAA